MYTIKDFDEITVNTSKINTNIPDYVKEQLFNKKINIYWNNLKCEYWAMDFILSVYWFSCVKIDMDKKEITLNISL